MISYLNNKKWFSEHRKALSLCAVLALFTGVSVATHFSSPFINDGDSFFYIRLSWLLRATGIFNTSFPWTAFSSLNSSSPWWGFSIFLIPFTYFPNLVLGIKIAGVVVTLLALVAVYVVARRNALVAPWLWPLATLFFASHVMYQFLMTRPQTISLALAPLLFSFLIYGNVPAVFMLTLGTTWFHPFFSWMPILLICSVEASRFLVARKLYFKNFTAFLVGTVLGWFLRPDAFTAAKLVFVATFGELQAKVAHVPLLVGDENFPLSLNILLGNFTPWLIIWFLSLLVFMRYCWKRPAFKDPSKRIFLYASFLLSCVFFALAMLVAQRMYTLWAEFTVLFIGAIVTYLFPLFLHQSRKTEKLVFLYTPVLVVLLLFTAIAPIQRIFIALSGGVPPDMFKEAGLWLKDHSKPHDVVFNSHWADFSPLFFWDQKNYYINGLDPAFQYAYNPALYWKYHFISNGTAVGKTCGDRTCTDETAEDTYEVLTRDFNAKYILVDQKNYPSLYTYLSQDSRYEKKLDTSYGSVFEVK